MSILLSPPSSEISHPALPGAGSPRRPFPPWSAPELVMSLRPATDSIPAPALLCQEKNTVAGSSCNLLYGRMLRLSPDGSEVLGPLAAATRGPARRCKAFGLEGFARPRHRGRRCACPRLWPCQACGLRRLRVPSFARRLVLRSETLLRRVASGLREGGSAFPGIDDPAGRMPAPQIRNPQFRIP